MARYIRPTDGEFEVRENEVTHKPTGATWIVDPGDARPRFFREAKLGCVLSNGDDYHPREVHAIAEKLLSQRLKRVTVYPFEVYNINSDKARPSRRMATLEAVEKIHGAKAIIDQGVEINEAQLDPEYPGMTTIDFKP